MKIWLKTLVCIIVSGGCFMLCRLLLVAPLVPVVLSFWGIVCFLFSWELSGSKMRIRNGIEQKTVLQLLWMAAGIICLLLVGGFLFSQI